MFAKSGLSQHRNRKILVNTRGGTGLRGVLTAVYGDTLELAAVEDVEVREQHQLEGRVLVPLANVDYIQVLTT